MARIFTEGFEMGDLQNFDYQQSSHASSRTETSTLVVRSGTYSARMVRSGWSGTGWVYLGNTFDTMTECFVRCAVRLSHYQSDLRNRIIIRKNLAELVSVRFDATTMKYGIYIGETIVAEGTSIINQMDNWFLVEFHYKADNVNGILELKLNGILEASFYGPTINNGILDFNQVHFLGIVPNDRSVYIDDIAINDTTGLVDNSWCGDGHIIALKPNASGDVSQLVNSDGNSVDNYTYVDDIPSDGDATYVWSDTAEEYDLYQLGNPSLPAYSRITRAYVDIRAKDPVNGGIAPMLKVGSTEYEGDETVVSYTYQAVTGCDYPRNPNTGERWTEEEINDLQAGVKIK